jgi:hypothetical protein
MRVAAYRLFWFDPITGVVLVGRSSRDVGLVGGGCLWIRRYLADG